MPHLVVEYAREVENEIPILTLLEATKDAAITSEVMQAEDIKVRALPYDLYLLDGKKNLFVHTTVCLLAGRTSEQKYRLSSHIRQALTGLLPGVKSLSVDVRDMDPETYLKRLLPD